MRVDISQQIEVLNLLAKADDKGESVPLVDDWPQLDLSALLLRTATELTYLVESQPNNPHLITRFLGNIVFVPYDINRQPLVLFRSEGEIDTSLRVGQRVTINGMHRNGDNNSGWGHFTPPLIEIKLLQVLSDTSP